MMPSITKYTKFIPYTYFIAITVCWFTIINRSNGLVAYPILLLGIPFLWQIIKPNKKLNFILGVWFICISSYLILAYLSLILDVFSIAYNVKKVMLYGGIFVFITFAMSSWILRNSLKETI